jgi:hypothetical protein
VITPIAIGDQVLIIYTGTRRTAAFWLDPTTWRTRPGGQLKASHVAPVVSMSGLNVFVSGGDPDPRRVDVYHTGSNVWSLIGRLPSDVYGDAELPVGDGRVLALEGDTQIDRVVDPLDLVVGQTRATPFIDAGGAAGTPSGGLVLAASRAWRYDSATGAWTPGPRLGRVGGGTATSLPDGRVALFRAGYDYESPPWLDILEPDGRVDFERPIAMPVPANVRTASIVAIAPDRLLVLVPADTCIEDDGCTPTGIVNLYRLDLGGN